MNSRKRIDYAKEAENMTIHFSKEDTVLIEILDASEFISELSGVMNADKKMIKT